MKFKKLLGLFLFLVICAPTTASAAMLYLDPAEVELGPGDNIAVNIRLDIDSECINTVEAALNYPSGQLSVMDFISGDSILSLWVKKPESFEFDAYDDAGEVYLAGGIPGGYCGKLPGDPGVSNIVGKLIFKRPSLIVGESLAELSLSFNEDKTRVFLNDGLGSEDILVTKGATIKISDRRLRPEERWRDQIKSDRIPPLPFVVELRQDDDMFDGQYYIVFYTFDKQSGVDRYEVLEIRPGEKIGAAPEQDFVDKLIGEQLRVPEWKRAETPYLLEDQELLSTIKVRAVDKAGNERLVEYIPPIEKRPAPAKPSYKREIVISLMIAGVLLLIGILAYIAIRIIRRLKLKHKNNEEEANQ